MARDKRLALGLRYVGDRPAEEQEPRPRRAQLAGDSHQVAVAGAVAVRELVLATRPADHGDRREQLARGGHVAARDGRSAALGERLHRLHQLERRGFPEPLG